MSFLRSSFIHLPKLGPAAERKLWDKGVREWGALDRQLAKLFPKREDELRRELESSHQAFERKDWLYFSGRLPKDQLWRLIPETLERAAYLDIETTGTGMPPLAHSTTITFYFQGQVLQAHETDAKRKLIQEVLAEASLIVTFFGDVFDIPFLEKEFGIPFQLPRIDLCFWLRRQGMKGGLKRVQKLFPEIPARLSWDLDGFDAVRLWRLHRQGVEGALETLLAYNAEDTFVLEPLLVKAFNREIQKFQEFPLKELPFPSLPELKITPRSEIYALLRQGTPSFGIPLQDRLVSGSQHGKIVPA